MDAENASNTPEWRPQSSPPGPQASAASSLLHVPHLSLSDRPVTSSTNSEHSGMPLVTSLDATQAVKDITPWETVTCERLTQRIQSLSISRPDTDSSQTSIGETSSLDEALKDAAIAIRFNAKWFSESALAVLLEVALDAAATSFASTDLYAAVTLLDVIGTYSFLPASCLKLVVRFLSQAYYGSTRAFKTRRLAEATWATLQHILESHLRGQCLVALLEVIDNRDSEHLATKAGYAQVAGALMIASEKILLKQSDRSKEPTLRLTEFLDSLWGPTVYGSDNLREVIMDIVGSILEDDQIIKTLDTQTGWDSVLKAVEPCVALSATNQAIKSVIEKLVLFEGHFEPRQTTIIARLAVECDLPLTPLLTNGIVFPWDYTLSAKAMQSGLQRQFKKLGRSSRYSPALLGLVEKCMTTIQLQGWDRETLGPFLRTFRDLSIDRNVTKEASAIFAKALVAMFMDSIRFTDNEWEKNMLFEALCKISVRCIDAAEALFQIRADVDGVLYLEKDLPDVQSSDDDSSTSIAKLHYDVSSLPLETWDDALLSVLRGSTEWEIYHCFLTSLPSLLGNHTMFNRRIDFIKRLRAEVCELLETGDYPEPPQNAQINRSHITVGLIQVLSAILGYHRHLSKSEILNAVSIFLNIAGSRDFNVSIPCIHALTICCYELPDLMSSYMDDIIDKMSKMVTQRYLAIHVLLFLAGLSRLPDLFRNFQTHDYKKIFGVCGSYLQSIRGTSALSERLQTPSSDHSSRTSTESADALPQYVYALAHHVLAFWYIALKSHDRRGLKDFITSFLKYIAQDGKEIIEDQGLVTIDLMDRVDAEESRVEDSGEFDNSDGRLTVLNRLAGLLLITTETALRTGKTLITVRRATGTRNWEIPRFIDTHAARGVESSVITIESSEGDCISVFPDDVDGTTYGKIYIPRPDSVLGSEAPIILPEDDSVMRAIQSFDRTSALDSHKAGVIYIGEGQTTESEIFNNRMGSPDYVEFTLGLGSLVELKNANFNTQGLDRSDDADGQHTMVWQNDITELVFHITTFMPNDEDVRLNTANKKRHIGNDHVNIVFNNSGAPFDFNTFPSQFNSVYIVITPSARTSFVQTRSGDTARDKEDRFYTVGVLTRPGYPAISSAAEDKVISGASLSAYVRNMALNECVFSLMWANRDETGEYPSSWRSRLHQLRRLWDRYGTE